jgi:hypothetical protein
MNNGSHSLERRDPSGLTLPQRRLLQELALTPAIEVACEQAEVRFSTLKNWLQRDQEFQVAYDDLLKGAVEIAKELIESSAVRASAVYEDALTAMSTATVNAQCPGCGAHFEVEASRPDWNTRLRAANAVSKIAGLVIDQHRIEKISFTPNLEEMLAIARARRGQSIPPAMKTKLLEKGVRLEDDSDPRKL